MEYKMKRIVPLAVAGIMLFAALPCAAKEIVVQMKTSGTGGFMMFDPAVVNARVGDTVRFVPTQPSHNAETIPAIWPVGAAPIKGEINKEVVLNVSMPGIYGIKCSPHYSMGMVALVIAGNANRAAAQSATLPPLAMKRVGPALMAVK
jgi:pseudoazurin